MSESLAKTSGREPAHEELYLGMCRRGACQPSSSVPPRGNPESHLSHMQKGGDGQGHLQSMFQHVPQIQQSHSPPQHAWDQSRSSVAHHNDPEAAKHGHEGSRTGLENEACRKDLGQTQMEKSTILATAANNAWRSR